MGIELKMNKDKLYQLVSTNSGEKLHDENWITEEGAKSVLIDRAFWEFMEKVVEIDMTFPSTWRVNDLPPKENRSVYLKWAMENIYSDIGDQVLAEKCTEVMSRLGFDYGILNPPADGKN